MRTIALIRPSDSVRLGYRTRSLQGESRTNTDEPSNTNSTCMQDSLRIEIIYSRKQSAKWQLISRLSNHWSPYGYSQNNSDHLASAPHTRSYYEAAGPMAPAYGIYFTSKDHPTQFGCSKDHPTQIGWDIGRGLSKASRGLLRDEPLIKSKHLHAG